MEHQINIYDTVTLVQLVPNLMTSQNFLLDRFFPNVVESDNEFVAIDVDVGRRRMAPFCSPLVAGQLVESRRYQTNVYKPPYIKDKRAPDLRKPIRRQIGEQVGGNIPAADRAALNMMFEMTDQLVVDTVLWWVTVSYENIFIFSLLCGDHSFLFVVANGEHGLNMANLAIRVAI